MELFINQVSCSTTHSILTDVLRDRALHIAKGIAVAVNNNVIPKSEWDACILKEHDRITIITATQGG